MTTDLSKTYYLHVDKWRCGGDVGDSSQLGTGPTKMLNNQGYMCCLGQCAEQRGVHPTYLMSNSDPDGVSRMLKENFADSNYDQLMLKNPSPVRLRTNNSSFAVEAMRINDALRFTKSERAQALVDHFAKHGYRLIVVDPYDLLS